MSDKQETIADIIAEKRRVAAAIRADLSCVPVRRDDQLAEADAIDEEADRLEAAHRRELAAGGDAAKLREALDYCRDMVADLIHHIGHDEDYLEREMKELVAKCNTALAEPPRNFDAAATREALQAFAEWFDHDGSEDGYGDIRDKARAALSAPPRNCDRFATADDAKREFNYLWNFVWQRGGGCLNERNYEEEFERWLFAPVADREGGNDGN